MLTFSHLQWTSNQNITDSQKYSMWLCISHFMSKEHSFFVDYKLWTDAFLLSHYNILPQYRIYLYVK